MQLAIRAAVPRTSSCGEAGDDPDGLLQATTGLARGTLVAGKYRIDALIGAGGMGAVVAARHVDLDENVAIKLLSRSLIQNEEARARFSLEARATVKIKGESCARVFDVGALDDGTPYIVMELLEGRDLWKWLEEEGPLPTELAVDFVLQACVALAEAHALGIVHRDIKPSNLFCARRGDGRVRIKVLDFGISKAGDALQLASGSVTRPNVVFGSPEHMSPEQLRSTSEVDARTDIWALGATLYELLTSKEAFAGATFLDVAHKVTSASPIPLRELRPDVPEALEKVVLRCLEKDRADRFATVAELARALEAFGSSRAALWSDECAVILGTAATADALSSPPAPRLPSLAPVGLTKLSLRVPRRQIGLGAGAVVLLGALCVVGTRGRAPSAVGGGREDAAPASPTVAAAETVSASLGAPSAPLPSVPVEALPVAAVVPVAPVHHDTRMRETHSSRVLDGGAASPANAAPIVRSEASCDPPYTIDRAGHRQYKPECP